MRLDNYFTKVNVKEIACGVLLNVYENKQVSWRTFTVVVRKFNGVTCFYMWVYFF